MAQEDVVTLGNNISQMPLYSDVVVHPEITRGKNGGGNST
jgi:hypothetical protein